MPTRITPAGFNVETQSPKSYGKAIRFFYGDDALQKAQREVERVKSEHPTWAVSLVERPEEAKEYREPLEVAARIAFNRVGKLPAPEGLQPPSIYLLWGDRKGSANLASDKGPQDQWPPTYTFTPMGDAWQEWSAVGWEDCEIGTGTFEATGPDGQRYRWEVEFSHDGDPQSEFWGASFARPTCVVAAAA